MNTIGVIPARFASTRFPGKPLVKILGKTLIERVYKRAERSSLQRLLVATDDTRIVDEVLSFGGNVVLTGEHTSGTDRVVEALEGEKCDIVINIQGDEPLIKPEVIDTIIKYMQENRQVEVATVASIINQIEEIDDPNVVKVVSSKKGKALYFSRSTIPFRRDSNTLHYKHIGIYGYRRDFLNEFIKMPPSPLENAESLEQLRILENGFDIHISVVDYESIGVDLPEDICKVENALIREGDV
ncbi:MAG: 3-deoxy-manno-octulosonate cytidylyltransferase [Spirochaetota bacterium]|nr:3-deoxy-manno-octulosonate cytidylyltransferase [Spirochaetota bacterium]